MEVFLVLQWRVGFLVPELQGIFSTKALAEAVCKSDQYSVSPFTLDEALPDERYGEHAATYFPLAASVTE